ncbi:MAG: hypothetical protein WDN08_00045 [Rhizomicrobium sp.]
MSEGWDRAAPYRDECRSLSVRARATGFSGTGAPMLFVRRG